LVARPPGQRTLKLRWVGLTVSVPLRVPALSPSSSSLDVDRPLAPAASSCGPQPPRTPHKAASPPASASARRRGADIRRFLLIALLLAPGAGPGCRWRISPPRATPDRGARRDHTTGATARCPTIGPRRAWTCCPVSKPSVPSALNRDRQG